LIETGLVSPATDVDATAPPPATCTSAFAPQGIRRLAFATPVRSVNTVADEIALETATPDPVAEDVGGVPDGWTTANIRLIPAGAATPSAHAPDRTACTETA
jgi:hypothetical protein